MTEKDSKKPDAKNGEGPEDEKDKGPDLKAVPPGCGVCKISFNLFP